MPEHGGIAMSRSSLDLTPWKPPCQHKRADILSRRQKRIIIQIQGPKACICAHWHCPRCGFASPEISMRHPRASKLPGAATSPGYFRDRAAPVRASRIGTGEALIFSTGISFDTWPWPRERTGLEESFRCSELTCIAQGTKSKHSGS